MKVIQTTPIDIIGPISGNTGWATHTRSFARELNKITPVSFRTGSSRREFLSQDFAMLWRGKYNPPNKVGIIVDGEPYPKQLSTQWIVWETTILPKRVLDLCETTDYLWTPSSWGYNNLINNGIEENRVSIVPEGVDTNYFKPAIHQQNKRFRFLFVGKWEERKCVEQLASAFSEEFKSSENVELVLHAHNSYIPNFSQQNELDKLKLSNDSNIILSGPKNKAALRKMYQSAQCFVMPTRSEGWGLPILESMACGVPAIVTAYSAPLDYLTPENSYLLNSNKLIDARCDKFNIHTGQWADPDINHLKHLMRRAFENPAEAISKGKIARETALSFTWKNAAKIAYDTITSYKLAN